MFLLYYYKYCIIYCAKNHWTSLNNMISWQNSMFMHTKHIYALMYTDTVYPRSLDSYNIVTYYVMEWVNIQYLVKWFHEYKHSNLNDYSENYYSLKEIKLNLFYWLTHSRRSAPFSYSRKHLATQTFSYSSLFNLIVMVTYKYFKALEYVWILVIATWIS